MRKRRDNTRALIRRKVQPCTKTMPARKAKERQVLKLAEIGEAVVDAERERISEFLQERMAEYRAGLVSS